MLFCLGRGVQSVPTPDVCSIAIGLMSLHGPLERVLLAQVILLWASIKTNWCLQGDTWPLALICLCRCGKVLIAVFQFVQTGKEW